MGASESEFGRFTPDYFMHRLHGMRKAQKRQYQNDWERARWQVYALVQSQTKRQLRETDFIRFDWDKSNIVDWDEVSKALPKTIPNDAFDFKRPLKIASFGNNTELPEA